MKSQTIKIAAWPLILYLLAAGFANAENPVVPPLINYQGMLTDADGAALSPDGQYTLEFRLWSDSTTKAPQHLVWGRAFPVIVIGGYFNVILSDDSHELADADQHRVRSLLDAFAAPERYLGITITNAPADAKTIPDEIAPRQQILSAPYAMQSQEAYHAVKADHADQADQAHVLNHIPQIHSLAVANPIVVNTTEQTIAEISIERTRINPADPQSPFRPIFIGITGQARKRHGTDYRGTLCRFYLHRNGVGVRNFVIYPGPGPDADGYILDSYYIDVNESANPITYRYSVSTSSDFTNATTLSDINIYAYELYLQP